MCSDPDEYNMENCPGLTSCCSAGANHDNDHSSEADALTGQYRPIMNHNSDSIRYRTSTFIMESEFDHFECPNGCNDIQTCQCSDSENSARSVNGDTGSRLQQRQIRRLSDMVRRLIEQLAEDPNENPIPRLSSSN